MKVVLWPHHALLEKTYDVDASNKHWLEELIETMHKLIVDYSGIGLAANQLGIKEKLFVINCDGRKEYFINPQIVKHSDDKVSKVEGCLSYPGIEVKTTRSSKIIISWQDLEGNTKEEEFSGLKAICVQHEMDHLNGNSIIDFLSPLKRKLTLEKFTKLKKKFERRIKNVEKRHIEESKPIESS